MHETYDPPAAVDCSASRASPWTGLGPGAAELGLLGVWGWCGGARQHTATQQARGMLRQIRQPRPQRRLLLTGRPDLVARRRGAAECPAGQSMGKSMGKPRQQKGSAAEAQHLAVALAAAAAFLPALQQMPCPSFTATWAHHPILNTLRLQIPMKARCAFPSLSLSFSYPTLEPTYIQLKTKKCDTFIFHASQEDEPGGWLAWLYVSCFPRPPRCPPWSLPWSVVGRRASRPGPHRRRLGP